jgi:hypothetical protein
MLIGRDVQMIGNPRVLIVFFLGPILSLGAKENNLLSLGPVQKRNTSLLQIPLLSSYGFKLFFVILVFDYILHQNCGVII